MVKKSIAIGIPSGDMVHMDFASSIISLMVEGGVKVDFLINERRSQIVQSREWLVKQALELGCTHLLMLDSDMVFPPQTLSRLLSLNKPVVAVPATTRVMPVRTNVLDMDGKRLKEIPEEVFKVKAVGTAIMLLDLSIFETMEEPWFWLTWDDRRKDVDGEDFTFCYKFKDGVWCDGTLTPYVSHLGQYPYSVRDLR